jgi:hypothetical protein
LGRKEIKRNQEIKTGMAVRRTAERNDNAGERREEQNGMGELEENMQ